MKEPVKELFLGPNSDILSVIFNFLPFVEIIKLSLLNKAAYAHFEKNIPNISFSPAALKKTFTEFFTPGYSPTLVRRAIEGFFSKKANVNELAKNQETLSFEDMMLFALMGYLYHIKPETVEKLSEELLKKIKQNEDVSSNRNLLRSFGRIQYAKGDKKYRQEDSECFLKTSYNPAYAIFTNFNGADISNENLAKTQFPGSSFIASKLKKTIFDNANLSESNLRGADVDDTNFKGTNLMSADFTGSSGTPIFDKNTILIGVKGLSWCQKRAAENCGAILTLKDLQARIKNDPTNFPESLSAQALKILNTSSSSSQAMHKLIGNNAVPPQPQKNDRKENPETAPLIPGVDPFCCRLF